MASFLKLTRAEPDVGKVFVNLDAIEMMRWVPSGDGYSQLSFDDAHSISVKETPEQIIEMLADQTR